MRVIIYFTAAAQRRAQQNQQGKSLLRHHSLNSHERGEKGGGISTCMAICQQSMTSTCSVQM